MVAEAEQTALVDEEISSRERRREQDGRALVEDPRMQIGLYLQLLDLRRGRLVWGLDHTWDTTDRATEQRIKAFFRSRMRDGYGPLDWRMAVTSPKVFQKFVACEVAETLTPDPPAVAGIRAPAARLLKDCRKTWDR